MKINYRYEQAKFNQKLADTITILVEENNKAQDILDREFDYFSWEKSAMLLGLEEGFYREIAYQCKNLNETFGVSNNFDLRRLGKIAYDEYFNEVILKKLEELSN